MHKNAGCPVISTAWRIKADPFSGVKTGSIRQRMCHGDVIKTGLTSPEPATTCCVPMARTPR
jgi:hypothetical protein